MNTNQCPHCQAVLTRVNVEVVYMEVESKTRTGFTYGCPMCHSVLGIQMDPMASLSDFKEEICKEFLA